MDSPVDKGENTKTKSPSKMTQKEKIEDLYKICSDMKGDVDTKFNQIMAALNKDKNCNEDSANKDNENKKQAENKGQKDSDKFQFVAQAKGGSCQSRCCQQVQFADCAEDVPPGHFGSGRHQPTSDRRRHREEEHCSSEPHARRPRQDHIEPYDNEEEFVTQYQQYDQMRGGNRLGKARESTKISKPYMYLEKFRPGLTNIEQKLALRENMGMWEYLRAFLHMIQDKNSVLCGSKEEYLTHYQDIMEDCSKGIIWEGVRAFSQALLDDLEAGNIAWSDKSMIQVMRWRHTNPPERHDDNSKFNFSNRSRNPKRNKPQKSSLSQNEAICRKFNWDTCNEDDHHKTGRFTWLHFCNFCAEAEGGGLYDHAEIRCKRKLSANLRYQTENPMSDHHPQGPPIARLFDHPTQPSWNHNPSTMESNYHQHSYTAKSQTLPQAQPQYQNKRQTPHRDFTQAYEPKNYPASLQKQYQT